MLWWLYPRWAGRLMTAWFLLSLVTGSVVSVHQYGPLGSHPSTTIASRLVAWAISAFFAWRVTRGGRISRMLLILTNGDGFITLVVALAKSFELAELGMLALVAAQLALLLSPAVYRRTRAGAEPGANVALWRRRQPAPLVTALAAAAALGLTGMAVCVAVVSDRVRDYDAGAARVQPGHSVSVTLSPGHYGAFGRCDGMLGCGQIDAHSLSVRGALSGAVGLFADDPYTPYAYRRTFGGQPYVTTSTFTIPVREPVRFALSTRISRPAVIALVQDKGDLTRGWSAAETGFGLLLFGSLAGLAWPVRRGTQGRW
jgi:hypothetical protein